MDVYEKLGVFYLGKEHDLSAGKTGQDYVLYDAKDLTTHAVIVGMTGSGKTGLGVTILEEAAIDGIPSIVIDPKGDLGNLLLAFPQLQPADFRPWVDPAEATRKGLSADDYAGQLATTWKNGLAEWNQTPERVGRYQQSVETAIYTPGSDAGIPLSVLRSLDAPSQAVRDSADAMRERVISAASGLLALVGVEGDPLQSREHILISNILDKAWREGRNLDMAGLIREIQKPSFDRIGVLDLETMYPQSDRVSLAMTVNNVLAAPGFQAWAQGEPLNVQRLLYTADGKPRMAVITLAHLSDRERMFFVTILLNEVIAWMRSQPGTSSLRALLYMDEVFGYLPPTANPPSKTPMLTLLKQARAFGLGLVLSTQNPVDVDYKALSNAGTWFLGRLQTERDKMRVLEGLEGASAAAGSTFDRQRMEATLAGLGQRVFLMNNVHEDVPVVFKVRWALSYLRGPLTRDHIRQLMAARRAGVEATGPAAPLSAQSAGDVSDQPPVIPPTIPQVYLPATKVGGKMVYKPALVGMGRLHFVDAKSKVDAWQDVTRVALIGEEVPADVWGESDATSLKVADFETEPTAKVAFASVPGELTREKSYATWKTGLKSALYQSEKLTIYYVPASGTYTEPGLSEGDARARLRDSLREARDLEVEKLRKKLAPKTATLEERLRKAQQRIEQEKSQSKGAWLQSVVSAGASIIGMLGSRKKLSATNLTKAGSAVRAATRATEQSGDVGRAEETAEALEQQLADLQQQLESETQRIQEEFDADKIRLEPYEVKARKTDTTADTVALLWLPYTVNSVGAAEPAFELPIA